MSDAPKAKRPNEHVSAADQRATAQHETEHDAPRTRRHRGQVFQDEFAIPIEEIPSHLTYEWKKFSVYGQEDPFYLARMREQGFEPVPPSRHPTWLPPGYNAPHIIKGGQILMDRPKELTEEAIRERNTAARQQIVEAEQKLGKTPKDTMTRDHEGARPKIVKEVGRMVNLTVEE
jgi:hypothetical protein